MKRIALYATVIVLYFVNPCFSREWIKLEKNTNDKSPKVKLVSEKTDAIIIDVEFPAFSKGKINADNFTFDAIDFSNASRFDKAGVPDIPYVSKILALANTGNPEIEILETSDEIILKNYNLPPVRKSWLEGEKEPDYVTSKSIYGKDEFYPSKLAEAGKPMIFRDFRIARISVYPLRYNPVTKELKAVTHIRLKITYDYAKSVNEKRIVRNGKISPTFDRIYRSVIFNYDAAVANSGLTTKGGKDLMLCIMPDEFYDSFQRYAEWKRKTGVDVHVTKFSDIGANSSDPNIIKNHILDAYENWETPPTHVLLIGDDGVTPVKYVTYDWTFVNEDFFVELEGDDFIPEMLIGRFTNQGDYRMRVMIDKFIKYEQLHAGDDPEWFTRAAVCSNDAYSSQIKTKRFTARVLREDGNFTVVDTLMSKTGCPYNLNDVKAKINAGISFLNYRGEGWDDGWHASCYNFSQSDVASLHNEMKLPFVTSIGCGVAMFNSNEGNCFGETWIQLGAFDYQRGACAFVGPTSNTHTTYNNRIDKGIYVGMFREGLEMPAEALLRGKFYMYNVFGATHWVEYHFRIYTTLGDPSIHVWKGTPKEVNVEKPQSVNVGFNQLVFGVKDFSGLPVTDAQIVLYNDENYLTKYVDENGEAMINITFPSAGTIYYTVRGSKVVLYEDSLEIERANEAVGIDGEPQLSDGNGNNDGLVEPNEEFEITFSLKNWGRQVSTNVEATLTVPDTSAYLSVQNTTPITFGNIEPNETVAGSPFSLRTSSDAPIGVTVPLTLNISSSNANWSYKYEVKIDGCKLRYSDFYVNDEGGLIENFKLDPGETDTVYLKIVNLGKDLAQNVSGILRSRDQYVTVEDSTGVFGTVAPHEYSVSVRDAFLVSVSADCPRNYKAQMELVLNTSGGMYPYSTIRNFVLDIAVPTSSDPTGPDEYGYYAYDITDSNYTEAPKFYWHEIADVGTEIIYTGSDYWTEIDLPFEFVFGGNTFSTITVSTDGWAALGAQEVPDNEWSNQIIPTVDGLKNLLAVFWDDFINEQLTNGKIYYYFEQHRHVFIIEWKDVDHYGDTNSHETFEIILFDPTAYPTRTGDGEILFVYKNSEETGSATIGIENAFETDGIEYWYNGSGKATSAEVQDNFAIKFTTDEPVLLVDVQEENRTPNKFELFQNYPNPFNPTTTISYSIPNVSGNGLARNSVAVSLVVYNILGQKVTTLVNKEQTSGNYSVRFDASDLPSGIYLYRLSAGHLVQTKKMILLK